MSFFCSVIDPKTQNEMGFYKKRWALIVVNLVTLTDWRWNLSTLTLHCIFAVAAADRFQLILIESLKSKCIERNRVMQWARKINPSKMPMYGVKNKHRAISISISNTKHHRSKVTKMTSDENITYWVNTFPTLVQCAKAFEPNFDAILN